MTPARADDPGWIIEQVAQFGGKQRQLITAKGARYESISGGYTTVAEAPGWNVFLFSDKKKIYFPCGSGQTGKLSEGRKGMLRAAVLRNMTVDTVWKPGYKATLLGHPMTVWSSAPKDTKVPLKNFRVVEYWAATDIPLSKQMADFTSAINGYPRGVNYVSIRCQTAKAKNPSDIYLDTQSIKAASISPALFKVPKGYKRASNELEVMMDTSELGDMLDSLGGGR